MCLFFVSQLFLTSKIQNQKTQSRNHTIHFPSATAFLLCLLSLFLFGPNCREKKQKEAREQARTDGTTREKSDKASSTIASAHAVQLRSWRGHATLHAPARKQCLACASRAVFRQPMEIASWTTCTGHLLDYNRCLAQPMQQ